MLSAVNKKVSSFTYLNITQFLGALNDNIYKLLVVFFLIQLQGIENSHLVLAVTGIIFVLPFLLFSAWSGVLADCFSKRNIIVITKVFELVIMILGLISFWLSSKYGCYTVLFLMATQSALFGPSKYGIVREIVGSDEISKANGLMTSFTYLAMILGTFLASFIVDITARNFIVAAVFCVGVAFVGMITSFCIGYTPPSGSHKKIDALFLKDIIHSLRITLRHPSLFAAIMGSSFFLFLAAFMQFNLIPYAVESLHLTDVQGGYLFLITAIGIGTGSFLAGKISGKTAELGLVPLAGLGIILCLYGLDLFSGYFYVSIALLPVCGLLGGIYLVPLDSFIQIASPKRYIGQIIAANNFLSFIGVLAASLLVYVSNTVFGFKADKGFTIVATITVVVNTVMAYQFFDYLTRFIGMVLSRLHFKTTIYGNEEIPESATLYVCSHTAWNDTLLLLGSQRRRMRFFIENEQEHNKWLKFLYRLLRVVLIPEIETLEHKPACLKVIKDTLKRGISVCLFLNIQDLAEFDKLKQAQIVRDILEGTSFPMLGVIIEKGEKYNRVRYFTRLFNKFRIPAAIAFEKVDLDTSLVAKSADNGEVLPNLNFKGKISRKWLLGVGHK